MRLPRSKEVKKQHLESLRNMPDLAECFNEAVQTLTTAPNGAQPKWTQWRAQAKEFVQSGRGYITPHGYYNTDKVSVPMLLELDPLLRGINPPEDRTWEVAQSATTISKLREHDTPIFWLDRELGEALLYTDIPTDLDLNDIEWPYEGMWFQLPDKLILSPSGSDVCSLLFAKFEDGYTPFKNDGYNVALDGSVDAPEGGMIVLTFTAAGPWIIPPDVASMDKEMVWRSTIPLGPMNACFKKLPQEGVWSDAELTGEQQRQELQEDTAFNESMLQFVTKILLYMMSRDKAVPKPRQIRKQKTNKKGKILKTPLWAPNVIGQELKIRDNSKDTDTDTDKRSNRPHWVRGHFRRQPYGKGRKLTKTVMIAPYKTGSG